jgi:hypothetical protein
MVSIALRKNLAAEISGIANKNLSPLGCLSIHSILETGYNSGY